MDEESERPREQPRRLDSGKGRISLVERAAGKLGSRSAGAGTDVAPPPAEIVSAALPSEPQSESLQQGGNGQFLPNGNGDSFHQELPPPPAPAGEAEVPLQASKGRRSKTVKIDLASLGSDNIITPGMKRNRTVEEFRLIKRMVLSRRWDESDLPGNTILVTSALPSEGKTSTAINLAISIAAEEDLRVVLIDADFIKPDALRRLGVKTSKGLIDVIQDPRMDISDIMLKTNIDKLSLIPSGQLHERCTELLASSRMSEIVAELASRYEDRILIFDSPPVLATTESVTLASHMGQIVFVVQAERTTRDAVDRALELIGERPHLGLVLNRTSARFGKLDFGAYYGSYYYGLGNN